MSSDLPFISTVPPVIAKGDSGASRHYIRPQDAHILSEIKNFTSNPVTLPNNTTITPSHKGVFQISNKLSTDAQQATVLPHLKNSSLISIGQLCDDDCNVELTKKELIANKNETIILRGKQNRSDGLWDIRLTQPNPKR